MIAKTRRLHRLPRLPRPGRRAACLVLLVVSALGGAAARAAAPPALRWTLVPKSCAPIPSGLPPIACGEYGTFYFGAISPGSCLVLASNPGEVLRTYAKSIGAKPFVPAGPEGYPALSGGPLDKDGKSTKTNEAAPKTDGAALQSPQDPVPFTSWVAVIDTQGNHAQSVAFLISELAGPDVDVQSLSVDDPSLTQILGSAPNDFHVIGGICSVLSRIEGPAPAAAPPSVINLSLGRKLETGDPASETSCNVNTASCQLAKLLARAKTDGAGIVVALGNQRDRMWPANLGSVIGAGQLSARALLDSGIVTPVWENPPVTARALFVGNSLCLAGWPAPAGSSYAAATASGLIARARAAVPGFNAYASGTLVPLRDPVSGRWGMARNGAMVGATSDALTALYGDLVTGSCWTGDHATDATEGAWGPGYAPRNAVPFPTWTSMTFSALPVEDPCTPCVAASDGAGGDTLTVNLSQAEPLDEWKHIDAVHLRVGGAFYALNLSEETRVLLKEGALQSLDLPGMAHLVGSSSDASIVFSILNAADVSGDPDDGHLCPQMPGSCYWIAIPLFPKE